MAPPAAPTLTQGARYFGATATGDYSSVHEDLKPLEYGNKIHMWWTDIWPTASIVQRINTKPIDVPVWYHFEEDELPYFATADAAAAYDATTLTGAFANHYTRFIQNDIWMNIRTRERMLINGTPAANMVVVRGWGAVPGQAILSGDRFVKVGYAAKENGSAPDTVTSLPVKYTFRMQDFRHSIKMSYRLRSTRMQVIPDELKRQRQKKRFEHMRDIRMSFFFGPLNQTQASTGEHTATQGIMDAFTTNTWNVGGALTQPDLFNYIGAKIAPWNRDKVIILATSAHVINIINQWAMEKIQVPANAKIKQWGIDIDHLLMIGGRRVALVEETEFNNDPDMRGFGFIVSPRNHFWRPFKGNGYSFTTKLYRDIETDNRPLTYKEEWHTGGGWEHWAERAEGWFWNAKW